MPFRLIPRNLMAHPLRSILTVSTIVLAVFLLIFLRSIVLAINSGVAGSATNRLIVQSAVSLFVDLPLSYQEKIQNTNGVQHVSKMQWFGGIYKEPQNFFAQFGIDPEIYFSIYPEINVVEGSLDDFKSDRGACIIGKALADRFDFKLGQRVPLYGTIFSRADGKEWEFRVAAIYRVSSASVDEGTLFFHFDYLSKALESGAADGPEGVGVYAVTVAPGADVTRVMADVDGLFANGPQRVQTTTEAEFQRQFVSMLGNVPTFLSAIGGGVFFAILLAALNTMLMAGRERTHDVGILKALGFSGGKIFAIFLLESLLLCGGGGAIGVGIAALLEPTFAGALATQFPGFNITNQTMALGFAAAIGIGIFAGIFPATTSSRMRPVDALRAEG